MARGNLILGQGAGKLGDVVLYRNAGKQQARAYVTNPKNPKSYKQALQRSKFASVSLAYQYFKTIIDRSTRYKDGRTAYNEFLKNNVAAAPYAGKSERQEWAGIYALPSQWVCAFGALARPSFWTPIYSAGTVSAPTTLSFGNIQTLCRQVLDYAIANGWLPASAEDGDEQAITSEQFAEAMAGAKNCHVCIAVTPATTTGDYSTVVTANGVQILELTAATLDSAIANAHFAYAGDPGEGGAWNFVIDTQISMGGIWGTLTIPNGSSSSTSSNNVQINMAVGVPTGHLFSAWIGNNSGTSVQVSNVIFEMGGAVLLESVSQRRDPAAEETEAAISSWQTAAVAGTDSQIY